MVYGSVVFAQPEPRASTTDMMRGEAGTSFSMLHVAACRATHSHHAKGKAGRSAHRLDGPQGLAARDAQRLADALQLILRAE